MKRFLELLFPVFISAMLFLWCMGVASMCCTALAEDDKPIIRYTFDGIKVGVATYAASRSPDENYSLESHHQACELFRSGIRDGHVPLTVYWSAVRVIAETLVSAQNYQRSWDNKKSDERVRR